MKLRINISFLAIVSLVFAAGAFAQTQSASRPSQNTPAVTTSTKKAVTVENIEQDVAEALSLIESKHVVGKKINYNDVFKSSIDGMLHSLDPHSNYFDAKEFEQFRTDQSSRYFGIGATIGDLSDAQGNVVATYIRATFENAPANRAGLRFGDKIVEVNGTSMIGKPFSEVRNFLRGPRGTAAKIVVERHGSGKRETVEIVRDAVPQPSIAEAYMIRPGVGYIAMTGGFNQTTYGEFAEAMRTLKAKGMKQLVLDLKNNGGGLVGQAYRVANTFLSTGQTVFTQKGRLEGTTEPYRAENPNPESMPIVVLVNRNSASASEILAGALQDHDRALIVGETTFGKGLVQNPFILDYGSMLLLTIAKYETPSGRLIQRDYSDGNLYSYYTKGGIGRDDETGPKQNGQESKTDSGRVVYSGGGITPDVEVKADTIPVEQARFQQRLTNPIFAFALDLAFGKVKGLESFKIDRPITFSYDLAPADLVISDTVFESFKNFAVEKYKYTPAQIEKERKFVERVLRSELVTAAYGSTTSFQVFNEYDNQLMRAIELLPQARQLAIDGAKARSNATSKNTGANK
ncbi:MAG: S41 family peptidase [Blastocatellia bacterium]|nr:S41 family peptidase [Chloracidobacterium sp.]MBL8184264.1 S41 family peptidase [Blastocatellia bacterium]HRJ87604.1 S41 family peptidase [Pyrinomonadaceae bacterium]HRK50561.1 S41 family peptidase [Pyrinomonadaceae bacterium]